MKVAPKVFKGIEYIQVSELPENQRENFVQSINDSLFIKILIDDKIFSGCVQYKDYELWYDGIFKNTTGRVDVKQKSLSAIPAEH